MEKRVRMPAGLRSEWVSASSSQRLAWCISMKSATAALSKSSTASAKIKIWLNQFDETMKMLKKCLSLVFLLTLLCSVKADLAVGQSPSKQNAPQKWEEIKMKWRAVPLSAAKTAAQQGDMDAQHYLGRV